MKEVIAAIIAVVVIGYCSVELMYQLDIAASKVVGRKDQIVKVVGE